MKRHRRIFLFSICTLLVVIVISSTQAEIITIDGVVKSINEKERTLSVEIDDVNKEFEVSSKAKIVIDGKGDSLDSLKIGQKVLLGYHDQLEVVVKILVESDDSVMCKGTVVSLFNGINLSGWQYDRGTSSAEREDSWTIDPDGRLICQGVSGHAFLLTDEKYRDFSLTLEWRIPEGVKPTKDGLGILVRTKGIHTPDQRSIAFQLNDSDRAASWVVGQSQPFIAVLGAPNKDFKNRLVLSDDKSTKPLGEWNTLEILCDGGEVVISQNGSKTIHLKDLDSVAGQICLMSQGTKMELRNLKLCIP